MTKIQAVASQKGGVGKTTTCVNLAYAYCMAGHRTLLVDLDPQANATSGLSGEPVASPPMKMLGSDPSSWPTIITHTSFENLDLAPSAINIDYSPLVSQFSPAKVESIRNELLRLEYDHVVIDCPPAAGPIPLMALQLADDVLIPVQCEYYAMEGLSQMLPMVDRVRSSRERPLELAGILLTMFEYELDLSRDVSREVKSYFPEETLETVIPRDVALAECSSHGKPIMEYDLRSVGAWSYLRLAKELLSGH